MQKFYVGQTLQCKNGDSVKIKRVLENGLMLEYGGKEYKRTFEQVEARLLANEGTHPRSQLPASTVYRTG